MAYNTRRLRREGNPPPGQLASPVPQYWNPVIEDFEDVLGAHGAPRAILYGPNGEPISQTNPLPIEGKVQLTGSVVEYQVWGGVDVPADGTVTKSVMFEEALGFVPRIWGWTGARGQGLSGSLKLTVRADAGKSGREPAYQSSDEVIYNTWASSTNFWSTAEIPWHAPGVHFRITETGGEMDGKFYLWIWAIRGA